MQAFSEKQNPPWLRRPAHMTPKIPGDPMPVLPPGVQSTLPIKREKFLNFPIKPIKRETPKFYSLTNSGLDTGPK